MGAAGKGHESCSGCSICLLVCPVWQARRDIRFSPQGLAKAIQLGVPVHELAAPVDACAVCAACEPACPEELPLVDMILDLRVRLEQERPARQPSIDWAPPTGIAAVDCGLMPDRALLARPALLATVQRVLGGMPLVADAGADIAQALECGQAVPADRLARFLQPLRRAQRLVLVDGLLARRLRQWLPGVRIESLGVALSSLDPVRNRLQAGDFYVIESRQYHADREHLVHHYDRLRQASGCSMNLDLQRLAVSTTAASVATRNGRSGIDAAEQARWMLEGLAPARIVVEDASDLDVLAAVSRQPVLHVAELADA